MQDYPEERRSDEVPYMGSGGGLMPAGIDREAFEPGDGTLTGDRAADSDVGAERETSEREGLDRTARPGQEGWTGDPGANTGDVDNYDADASGVSGSGI